ncbi:GGDEF domain-containing protein [Vibrio sinaloensis]|uniref:GGDEF domain-containing protein n=1 Tax=Photobacterium sp. (strain ATCC 43367) TaxID=379097 RepID=UPI00206BBDC6|nr:GGDEF domain-containing protein [Vibrio sinaloensis]UPQ88871.1 GGDEF domain-containing protein [Vibrio sinaloensis]
MNSIEYTEQIRSRVLRMLSFSFMFIVTLLAMFNIFFHGQYLFAALELIFSAFSLYVFVSTKNKPCHKNIILAYISYIALLIFLGTYLLPITDVLFLWGFFFPTVSYLLLGSRIGFRVTLAALVILGAIIVLRLTSDSPLSPEPVLINFFTCYLAIWCMSHYFELSRSQANNSLSRLASTDALTGTLNRLAFSSQFETHQGKYLLLIDIDNFKQINDNFGHPVGDQVLKKVADALIASVGGQNVYRIGGEEFCLWLPCVDAESAQQQADQIREHIAALSYQAKGHELTLTFSAGIVEYRSDLTEQALLSQADKLLYKAKSGGRNQVIAA